MGSQLGKVPLAMNLSGFTIRRAVPTADSAEVLTEREPVCYVTIPASSDGPDSTVRLPHPAKMAGRWVFVYCTAYATSSGDVGSGVSVKFREGNADVDVLAKYLGTADKMTKIYDRLVLFSDGERYHVVYEVTT